MSDRKPTPLRARQISAPRKVFTPEQAQKTLPLVRRILADIVAQYRLIERIQKRRRKLARQQRVDELKVMDEQGLTAAQRLSDLIDELSAIGCEVQDYEQGRVDFPSMRDGREVSLCWTLREDRIAYWHEKHAGFAGRRPL